MYPCANYTLKILVVMCTPAYLDNYKSSGTQLWYAKGILLFVYVAVQLQL